MRMHWTVMAGLAVVLATPSHAQQGTGLATVAYAMGATSLNSIEYTGSGLVFSFGQAYGPAHAGRASRSAAIPPPSTTRRRGCG